MVELSESEARKVILSSQGLLRPFPDFGTAMRSLLAVQSQYPANLFDALQARTAKGSFAQLDRLLKQSRTIYKTWSLRHTVHAHGSEDYALMQQAMEGFYWDRMFKKRWPLLAECFPSFEDYKAQVVKALSQGPMKREQLHDHVPDLAKVPHAGWGLDLSMLVYHGKVLIAEQGAARTKFALTEMWLGEPGCQPWPHSPAAELLRRYILAHGLATRQDFAYWTSALVVQVQEAFRELGDELVQVQVGRRKQPYFTLKEVLDRPQAGSLRTAMLSKFDPLILGWKDKSLFLAPEHAHHVIRPAAQIEATVLMQGKIVATWRLRRGRAHSYDVYPLMPLKPDQKERVVAAARNHAKRSGTELGTVSFQSC